MGKHKIKRFSALRPNPTGLITEDQQTVNLNPQALPPLKTSDGNSRDVLNPFVTSIIEKLQSPMSEERACGCQMLNGVVFQPKAIELLVEHSVARIIYPLFLDPSSDVQMNIMGAVRNMCIHGSHAICSSLVDSDILTPLTSVIKKYADSLKLVTKEAMRHNSSVDVLVEAVKLLSVLCENNPKTVSVFNKENLLQILLPLMNIETFGYILPCAVAQCLFVVTENNPEVTASLNAEEFLPIACGSTTETDATLLRTLVIGILLNLKEVDVTTHMEQIVKNISEVLDIDHVELLKLTLENQEQEAGKEISPQDTLTSDLDKLLHSQGICLELLANLCCSDDDWEDMEADMEESSDDQSVAVETGATHIDQENVCLTENVGSAFHMNNLLPKIMQKTALIDKCYMEKLQHFYMGRNVQYKLQELQSRALLCLSNVMSAMDKDTLTKSANLPLIWSNIYSLAESCLCSTESNEDYKWAVTSAMRALIERMAEFNLSDFSDVTSGNLEMMINIGATSSNHETQINVMRVLSTIGCVISVSMNATLTPLLTKIGLILLEVACKNDNIVVVSEALDCIFDVFKEDHTDVVVREIELVNKLKMLESTFRNKISSQRKQLGENYGVVMMAKANLKAYIKYKTGNS